ncbi:MetQ/NlpA family ABC transporter substrate-binding protein ['Crotalaria aegyptiaca' phytoplasma]|uniref:MetQ/NlpA family ABC transporter substrate-binding protein n=1 Tax=Candidatus Phytoplasma crotalariae TaxID=2982627 RepID=A0ABT9D2V1_9MOLU|nr:MetQ/NlpA family ABC transporter substrate-binding protein ['Crotalaria aegyptiaca' phytoplasma]MDO8059339.1 MetQ/NlpA family ABC transporter substrate-binding protein ['Crotalaria aegyptiaca' phytoplasma]
MFNCQSCNCETKLKKIIKIATNFPSTLETLQKNKHLINQIGFELQIFDEKQLKEKYQVNCNDALKEGIIDFNIANNFHTMKAYNNYFIPEPLERLEMIEPFFHPKYGLYSHKNSPLKIKNLEDVKKIKNARVLFAPFNDLFTAPCDLSRSLLLLKKLNLIKINEQIIQKKGYNLSLEDIENISNLQFIKTDNIFKVVQLFDDYNKYDLAINCPGLMRQNNNFLRLGSIGLGIDENEEPTDIVFSSYAIILAAKKNCQNNQNIQAMQWFLRNKEVQQTLLQTGQPNYDYIIVGNPEQLKYDILNKFDK